jgi:preprotein translocase SecE subunit
MTMSVAEYTASERVPRSPQVQLAASSFLGALYVLFSLGFVFSGLPTLWGQIFPKEIVNEFLSGALLILVSALALAGVGYLGYMLLKAHDQKGVRAGTVVASVFLFLIAWAGFSFANIQGIQDLGEAVGVFLAVALVAGLLFVGFRLFLLPSFYALLLAMEEQGWFHAYSFKPNQGYKVRRATVIGLLTLGICGIITLVNNRSLGSDLLGPNDWYWPVPFTTSNMLGLDVEKSTEGLKITKVDPNLSASKYLKEGDILQAVQTKEKDKEGIQEITLKEIQDYNNFLTKAQPGPATLTLQRDGQPMQITTRVVATHRVVPLLYKIHVTFPLLLSVGLLWVAWRVVNWPIFADFLIATEAEINKVSWTTRRRLIQDTAVVLVTVFILTTFLFAIDILWIRLLNSPWIHVLQLDVRAEQMKQQEKTQW